MKIRFKKLIGRESQVRGRGKAEDTIDCQGLRHSSEVSGIKPHKTWQTREKGGPLLEKRFMQQPLPQELHGVYLVYFLQFFFLSSLS